MIRAAAVFRSTIRIARAAVSRDLHTIDFDLNLVVPDPSKSWDDGAIEP